MNTFVAIPTWLITKAISPFLPKEHPLKQAPTLEKWTNNSTDLNRAFGVVLWLNFFLLIIVAFELSLR